MGVQFERITHAPQQSLAFIMDDLARHHREGVHSPCASDDLDGWLNALQRQAKPLISSKAGKDELLAWLDAVDEILPAAE